jgi:hypothetical protein
VVCEPLKDTKTASEGTPTHKEQICSAGAQSYTYVYVRSQAVKYCKPVIVWVWQLLEKQEWIDKREISETAGL